MTTGTGHEYLLGHSGAEHRRLMIQSHCLRPWTSAYLTAAGIGEGMSVLDAGSGLGDVSLIAAGLVGPGGRVVGVERDPDALALARARFAAENLDHVEFRAAALDAFDTDERFDALVGRLVLPYQPDPAATLRRLSRFVRPGGIVAFHETTFGDATGSSVPPNPLWDACFGTLGALMRSGGLDPDFGHRLYRTFLDAGLPAPAVDIRGFSGGRAGSALYSWMGTSVEALVPLLRRAGVPVPPEVTCDGTLPAVLERSALETGSLVTGPVQYGAWTRLP